MSNEENSDKENSDEENLKNTNTFHIKMINKYYPKHKERLRKKIWERYQNFIEEQKEKRCQYYQKRKQKLPEFRRNYYLTHKGNYWATLKILGWLNLFHGLLLEMWKNFWTFYGFKYIIFFWLAWVYSISYYWYQAKCAIKFRKVRQMMKS